MSELGPSKILYITHSCPVPAKLGPARRHHHILDQLSTWYDVSVLSLGSPRQAQLFDLVWGSRVKNVWFSMPQYSRSLRYFRKSWRTLTGQCDFLPASEASLHRICAQLARRENFDAVFLSCVLLRRLPIHWKVPIIGDTHNVESEVLGRTAATAHGLLRRWYSSAQYPFTQREEAWCARNVDLLLATSACDQKLFEERLGVRRPTVIPNGIDLREFYPRSAVGQRGSILFTGLMSYYPNQQGVSWFLKHVFPLILKSFPKAKFVIAGASPPRWLRRVQSSNVEVTGEVKDMREYFDRACCIVAPLHIGGGTRVKILEAQAMARPVVSTALGAEGLEELDGHSILLADDSKTFAEQVVAVLKDPLWAAAISMNGRNHVTERFDWCRIGNRLVETLGAEFGLLPKYNKKPHINVIDEQKVANAIT